MAEYIERNGLIGAIRACKAMMNTGVPKQHMTQKDMMQIIEKVPTADVVEVVHGKWVDHCVRDWRCSKCGEKINKVRNVDGYCYDDKPNYCPNCGARMDGDKDAH